MMPFYGISELLSIVRRNDVRHIYTRCCVRNSQFVF